MPSQLEKCATFAELHNSPTAWIIPNPWDVGSAKLLQGLGFQALATTSSGFAYTRGCADGEVNLEEKLEHCRALAAATTIPLNADFENGFAEEHNALSANIESLLGTGIAGFSIEDYSREEHKVVDFYEAVDRIQVAVQTIAESNIPIVLTARAENLLRGVDDVDDTIKRLNAFAVAGADVLYAPGIRSLEHLKIISSQVDKPLNVLASLMPDATVADFTRAGASRISVGGALNYAAVNPVIAAGKEMLEHGSFGWLQSLARGAEIKQLFSNEDAK